MRKNRRREENKIRKCHESDTGWLVGQSVLSQNIKPFSITYTVPDKYTYQIELDLVEVGKKTIA